MSSTNMSHLIKIDYWDSLKKGQDVVVDDWFMMSSPWPVAYLLLAYLVFVLRIGPLMMNKLPALQLKGLMVVYNAAQVVLSLIVCYKCFNLNLLSTGILTAGCKYSGAYQHAAIADSGWWYFLAKATELLDTVFFVLRKKSNQVSFLHVYHHSIMLVFSWSYLKYAAGGQGAVLGLMNSLVHVIMYSYYGLAALGPAYAKYLWWKKYMTTIQLVQFCCMIVYIVATSMTPSCQYSRGFIYVIGTNITIFLYLFGKFFRQSYLKSRPTKVQKALRQSVDFCKNQNICGNKKCNGDTGDAENLEIKDGETNTKSSPCSEEDDCRPLKTNMGIGDYVKDGQVYICRRTSKKLYGQK